MKKQKNRSMKVYSQNGRNYKATPTIILKGQWLEEMGFAIGDYISVSCENGKLVITPDTERAELEQMKADFMEKETKKLRKRFQREKEELYAQFVAEKKAQYMAEKSAMIRYVSGIDQPIYPIAYIKNKIPMAKKAAVCSYTVEGRALIHTNLSMNSSVLSGLRNQPSMGRSTELTDSRISLFSAQRGKCALSGELFENAADIVCWLKTPAELGGKERYRNMILFHNRFLPLLQECPKNELKEIADTLKATKELMLKVNSLRQQAGLSAIEN